MPQLRAAVVGTGFIGAVHLESLRRIGVGIAGILGSSPEKGAAKGAEWGAPAYASYEELLADPTVDVVHITSPNDRHFDQAKAALLAGRHVVCEKPLAMTAAETSELVALAASTGLVAAVNFNVRFYPQVHEMRERVANGSTGAPYLVTGQYLQEWLLRDTDWNWRADSARGGMLRAVGDIGTHWFDVAQFVTGQRITEVMAELPTFVPVHRRPLGEVQTFSSGGAGETEDVEIHSEDAALILVRFEGGARGSVALSQVSAGRKNSIAIEVNGAQSSLAWRGEAPDELWIGHRDEPNQVLWRGSGSSAAAEAISTMPAGHIEGFENGFAALYRAVYADVAAGAPSKNPSYATFADGHRESLLLDAVAESARTERWVAVGD
ncbi:MAG: oxidoreductase domain protein [Microbacteriaceae bacterium]|nr:oxidoreductase domain protein [Microbacteriaceae bacterium]